MVNILEVKDLVVKFYTVDGVVNAVNGLSFSLGEGETLAIVGESGSGKSVSMMSILGLLASPPARIENGLAMFQRKESSVDLLKQKYNTLSDIRGGEVGFIFQDPCTSLNPILPIGKQISESLIRHLGIGAGEAHERTIEMLEKVGIADAKRRYSYYPFQLSGGMRQRVMIAIAVVCSPKLVIADEPTTALDVTIQAQIVDLFKQLHESLRMATIWISHDLGLVASLADRVMVMYGGQAVESAKVDDLYEHPLHPYTLGLLGAVPGLNMEAGKRLVSIDGTPPDLMISIEHCPFTWRCSRVQPKCWEGRPPLKMVGEQHEVACFLFEQEGDK
jgi:oligopeptide transport system ATP-binding protein